jgi:hypothetical protein
MKKKYAKLFTVENGVIAWLESLTDNVVKLNPLDIFKVYKPLDRGNSKLAKNILSFSLPSISTCGMFCKGCYDIRAMRYPSARKKRYVNYSMAYHKREELKALIKKQVLNSRSCDFVRLHVGGEFFSLEYVKMWKEIAEELKEENPDIGFYTYTKSLFGGLLKESGINVVRSIYPEGYNYGSFEYVNVMRKKYKGIICPVTVMAHNKQKVPNQYCGSACTACMNKENVFFVQH